MSKVFDSHRLYIALNRARSSRGITWNKVATRAGVGPTSLNAFIRQFEQPGEPKKAMAVENLVRLLDWMGQTDLGPYMVDEDAYVPFVPKVKKS